MPNKIQTIYVCSNCDAQFPKWTGRCLECGSWASLQSQTIEQKTLAKEQVSPASIIDLEQLPANLISPDQPDRFQTGLAEVDRVFGGGILAGSVVLLAGEPGIGKSTLVAQIAQALKQAYPASEIIYVSGEESAGQIKDRLTRLAVAPSHLKFISETNLEKIMAAVSQVKPTLVIIDSIQTIFSNRLPSEAGSLNQIRCSALSLLATAKECNIAFILIGHITKDGLIAGPKALEHIVDTVIYLETETSLNYRILRATKNRFGPTDEIGVFTMTAAGFKQVSNPSAVFLQEHQENLTGSVISSILSGSRPFLVEVQALVTKTIFGYPQRKVSGFDFNRLQVLVAVLTKRAGLNLTTQDVVLNLVGGFKVADPALDLAVCLAIASSLLNQAVDKKTLVLGEVGLGGEVRQLPQLERRIKAAEKLGFTRAILPPNQITTKKIKLIKIKNMADLIKNIIKK